MARGVGTTLAAIANHPLTDWRIGKFQLNPMRWLETHVGFGLRPLGDVETRLRPAR